MKDTEIQEIVQHTISGDDGKFYMKAPEGSYMLGVSFLGYKPYNEKINITTGKTYIGSIVLEESAQELQEVVVQGKIVKVHTKPDGFIVNVKQMREKANDALYLLKYIPKIQIKAEQLKVIGKEKVLVKMGNVLQRVDAS